MTVIVSVTESRNLEFPKIEFREIFSESTPKGFSRESPAFPVSVEFELPASDFHGRVLLFFTVRPFEFISAIISAKLPDAIKRSILVTHGFAAVVVPIDCECPEEQLLEISKKFCFATETWIVENSDIKEQLLDWIEEAEPKIEPGLRLSPKLLKSLEDSEAILLTDIYLTLDQASFVGFDTSKAIQEVLSATRRHAHELVLTLLYLERKIARSEFRELFASHCEKIGDSEFDSYVSELDDLVQTQSLQSIQNLQLLRDSLVQTRACLKYYYRQGFTCAPSLLKRDHPSGTYSLFGIGGCIIGLQSLFEHIQSASLSLGDGWLQFLSSNDVDVAREAKVGSSADAYLEYVQRIKSIRIPDYKGDVESAGVPHKQLIYFSSRFGFKATQIAVTASSESLAYCNRPAWHLATLLHEYVHLLVKPIFLRLTDEKLPSNEKVYRAFIDQYFPDGRNIQSTLNPIGLIAISFWYTSIFLRFIDQHGPTKMKPAESDGSERLIVSAIRSTKRDSEEIVVQVLEFLYFYQGDPGLYVRSIWASWLSLPATLQRKQQYLLRTLLAISVEFKGQKDHRFEKSYGELERGLNFLVSEPVTRQGAAEEILNYLGREDVKETLRHYFDCLVEFADLIAAFLLNPTLRTRLFTDALKYEVSPDLWKYPFEAMEYTGDRIESPVNFIVSQLRSTIEKKLDPNTEDNSEFESLWMLHVISASKT